MTADFPILLDACVLANFGVCDLFLRMAEPPRLFLPRWSEAILDDMDLEDTLIHLGKSVPRFASQILEDMGRPGGLPFKGK